VLDGSVLVSPFNATHILCLPLLSPAHVQAVLYGIFPAVLLGAAITYGLTRWQKKPLAKLAAAQATADISTNLRDVYRFTQPTQVKEGPSNSVQDSSRCEAKGLGDSEYGVDWCGGPSMSQGIACNTAHMTHVLLLGVPATCC